MINLECFERASCPRDEKSEAASLINLWVTLSEKARRDADAIIKALETEAPALSASIKAKMFVFEDLTLLDDRSIQKIIKEADSPRPAAALKGASLAVAEKFFPICRTTPHALTMM
jgi:flagellar motor switch protein FliG